MIKKIGIFSFILGSLMFTGCFNNKKDIIDKFKNKVENSKNYYMTGELKIVNNEDNHCYNVEVSYKQNDNFRVSLKNKTNNHEQIILKNEDGVFVLNPSLNKSFKFQSEWPYNNSQSYLLQSLVNDIESDKNLKITEKKDKYIIETKVDYPNNSSLIKQKIYLTKNGNVQKVEVLDNEGLIKIEMKYKKIDMNPKFTKKYFNLEENMSVSSQTKKTAKEIDSIIYPMYMPQNTYLDSQKTINTDNGQRVILTFSGDNPFMIIEEVSNIENEDLILPVTGEPVFLMDSIGYMTNNSAGWISNGIEYYAVSEVLNSEELLEVVNSINNIAVGK